MKLCVHVEKNTVGSEYDDRDLLWFTTEQSVSVPIPLKTHKHHCIMNWVRRLYSHARTVSIALLNV